jgi:signal transduction histidine kinase
VNPRRSSFDPAAFAASAGRRAVVLPFLLTALFAACVVGHVLWLRSSMARVERASTVVSRAEQANRLLVEGQAGRRGFLLTGAVAFLRRMDLAFAELPPVLAALEDDARDEVDLAQAIGDFRDDARNWRAQEESTLAVYRGGGDVVRAELDGDGVAQAAHARITGRIDSLKRERDARELRVRVCTEVTLAAVAALAVAVGVAIASCVRRDLLGVGAAYAGALAQAADARDQAEQANRLKDEFLGTMGHELRTPLNAIMGWTALLRRRPEDPHTRGRAIDVIDRNARAQAKLVDDMLDVSRIVSGQLHLRLERVDLNAAVGAAVESLAPAARAKRVRLDMAVEPQAHTIGGDRRRLQQAVWNLVANAVKFTPAEGHVSVTARRHDGQIEIRVADTGPGVAPEVAPRLFARFQRGDASSTRSYGGVGLGLAIVRHLVELHGGTVHAESPGEEGGATFVVLLPLGPPAQPDGGGGDAGASGHAHDGPPSRAVSSRRAGDGPAQRPAPSDGRRVTRRSRVPTGRTSAPRSRDKPV